MSTIETLELEVHQNVSSAVDGIDSLITSLSKLKSAFKGGIGFKKVTSEIDALGNSLNSLDGNDTDKIEKLAVALEKLKNVGKLSPTIGKNLRVISESASTLKNVDFSSLKGLSENLKDLNEVGKGAGMKSMLMELKKLPEVTKELNKVDWKTFSKQLQNLSRDLKPLASQLDVVSKSFERLPSNLKKVSSAAQGVKSVKSLGSGIGRTIGKLSIMGFSFHKAYSMIGGWIHETNSYIENLNLFSASLGKYTSEAKKYAERVGDIMGIDPGEFMRNQGIFMTISKGFGVASDRAYIMSKNLTQLGYDISSFFNISFASAMQKLQAGISGELEPLRRLGYDLSEARLKAEALGLGISKSFNQMTQAEKSQLRYYTIMRQVTVAQGDMARTLNAPANQLRVLQAQVVQCARALGSIFIPALNAILPYAIAFMKILRMVANVIAQFFNFKLPEVDYSGLTEGSTAVGNMANNIDDANKGLGHATKKAKELKNALIGIDELNVIAPDQDKPSAGAGGAGGIAGALGDGFDFKLPEYDFLKNAVSSKVEEIIAKFKEWLGVTKEVDTWSELLHTRLGRILTTVGSIALGIAAWKLSKSFIDGLDMLSNLKNTGLSTPMKITMGVSLMITGISLELSGIKDAVNNALNGANFAQIVSGALLTMGGAAFLGNGIASWIASAFEGKAVSTALTTAATNLGAGTVGAAGAALSAAVAGVIAGIPAYIAGIKDALKNGLNGLNASLIPFGSSLAGAGIGAIIGACGGPIGAGIGSLIGLAVGLVTDGVLLVMEHWNEITTFIKDFFTVTIPGLWDDFVQWVKDIPKSIEKFFDDLWKPIQEFDWNKLGRDMGKQFGEAIKSAVDFVTKKVPNFFSDVYDAICEGFSTFFTKTLPEFFTQTIPNFFETVVTSMATFFTETLPESLSDIATYFGDIGTAIWDGIVEGFTSRFTAIGEFISGFVDGVKEALGIHSPSKVFAEIGEYCIEGIFEGFNKLVKGIGKWFKDKVLKPIEDFIGKNPITIEGFVNLVKSGWDTVSGFIQTHIGSKVEKGIEIVRDGWTYVSDFVKEHIGSKVEKGIQLIRDGWSQISDFVKEYIGPKVEKGIGVIRSGWTYVSDFVRGFIGGAVDKGVGIFRSGWSYVSSFVNTYIGGAITKGIGLFRSGWTYVSSFVSSFAGSAVNKSIKLVRNNWSTVASWVKSKLGGVVEVGVKLVRSGWSSLKKFFGLATGGYSDGRGGFKLFEQGGFIRNGRSSFWNNIPMYANGTTNAGMHGSLFVAGENGAEMVGHLNGQTEVLNKSQISMAMRAAVISGMAQFTGYWRNINSQLAVCSNAIIRSILVSSDMMRAAAYENNSYDPTHQLSQFMYEDSSRSFDKGYNEGSSISAIVDFYKETVEPTLKQIADDTRRQADKEEQTIVKIGNRDITHEVEKQREANGYVFSG